MEMGDFPDLKEIKELHWALKKSDEDFVADFRDSGGMTGIYKVCAYVCVVWGILSGGAQATGVHAVLL